jgi:hypothetical protein
MKTKARTIITIPSNEPLSTSEQSLTRRAGGLGGGPCKIEESKRKHFPFRRLALPPSRKREPLSRGLATAQHSVHLISGKERRSHTGTARGLLSKPCRCGGGSLRVF